MTKLMISICILLSVFSVVSFASPHPGVGSSDLVSEEKGIFFSKWGFQLKNQGTSWKMSGLENKNELVSVAYRPAHGDALLSVHTDMLKTNYSLESYAKRWVRDYSNYGFDLKGTKFFQQGNAKGLVVDLIHKKKQQQLRQVIFLKDKTSVILSCQDNEKNFLQSLTVCNQIIKTFSWTNFYPTQNPQKAF